VNDADEWIFSEEAHLWMDGRRLNHASWNAPAGPYGSGSPSRSGWEHGLFGFKVLDTPGKKHEAREEDYLGTDMIYL
jgi:hypothetical protein